MDRHAIVKRSYGCAVNGLRFSVADRCLDWCFLRRRAGTDARRTHLKRVRSWNRCERRKGVGVEPTKNRLTTLPGFEARPPHRGTLPFRSRETSMLLVTLHRNPAERTGPAAATRGFL